ncbi:hypothetical protein ACFFRR_009850 [Megaselia abdita]
MMNFSAFGGPFSGIHQFAAKFNHDPQPQNTFGTSNSLVNGASNVIDNGQRYQTSSNTFSQTSATSVGNNVVQYGQNIGITYSTPPLNQHDSSSVNPNEKSLKFQTKIERDREEVALNQQILQNVNQSWQTLAAANSANSVDYSSHLLSATLPISIQHFLKYSETIKKESSSIVGASNSGNINFSNLEISTSTSANNMVTNVKDNGVVSISNNNGTTSSTTSKKTKKKKTPKEKKPRPKPGEIRETKALDGSTLYCCPECQMAYPDRSLIEQHVISHAVERRFVCDICNAALKRKDHLTRHKLSHIPDRPHVCNNNRIPQISTLKRTFSSL